MELGRGSAADPQEGAEIRNKKAFKCFSLSVSLISLLFSASVVGLFFLTCGPNLFIRVALYGCCIPPTFIYSLSCLPRLTPNSTYVEESG